VYAGAKSKARQRYKSHKMALWNDLIPRLHRPRRVVNHDPSTLSTTLSVPQRPSTPPATPPPSARPSTPPAMERDGRRGAAMSAVGQDRKSSHDLQRDADVIGGETGNSNGGEGEGAGEEGGVTVSFGLAVTVGSVLLLLNVAFFVATMCQWPRLQSPSK